MDKQYLTDDKKNLVTCDRSVVFSENSTFNSIKHNNPYNCLSYHNLNIGRNMFTLTIKHKTEVNI